MRTEEIIKIQKRQISACDRCKAVMADGYRMKCVKCGQIAKSGDFDDPRKVGAFRCPVCASRGAYIVGPIDGSRHLPAGKRIDR